MATIYCWSGATGLADGSSWTDAYTTFQAALTAWTTADVIYLASDHSETFAAHTTLSCANATNLIPCKVVSVDRADDSYKPATAAQLDTSGDYYIWLTAYMCMYGVYVAATKYIALDTTASAGYSECKFYDCTFKNDDTAGTNYLACYGKSNKSTDYKFYNCTFISDLGAAIYYYSIRANMYFYGCSLSVDTSTYGLVYVLDNSGTVEFIGCDFTGSSFGVPLIYTPSAVPTTAKFVKCLMPSSFSLISGTSVVSDVEVISSDSAGNLDRYEWEDGAGNSIVSTTSVYRDNGYNGVDNQLSYKVTPVSTTSQYIPINVRPIYGYISTTGSKTIALEIAHDFTSSLTDTDISFELMYLGTASETLHSLEHTHPYPANGKYEPLASGTTLTSSSETWTGAAGLTKQKISKTVTINKAGLYAVIPRVATYEATKVIYIDPKVSVS